MSAGITAGAAGNIFDSIGGLHGALFAPKPDGIKVHYSQSRMLAARTRRLLANALDDIDTRNF
jgi:hypothetical protein